MKISLKNIGIVKNANVEINGITVIAGENNTGKSTVGKGLYSVFNSFYNITNQIKDERVESVENYLDFNQLSIDSYLDTNEIATTIIENRNNSSFDIRKYLEEVYLSEATDENSDTEIESFLSRIIELANVDDNTAFQRVLQNNLYSEFKTDINNKNIESSGSIILQIKNELLNVEVKEDSVIESTGIIDLRTKVIYIDDPYVLDDDIRFFPYRQNDSQLSHRYDVKYNLLKSSRKNLFDEIVDDNRLNSIFEIVNKVFDGDIISNRRNGVSLQLNNNTISMTNASSGLKTFVIIKRLLQNGSLENNGTIILDEPEIHLHPEWQILFAELIVLIQKQFNMHILINTHSPYFLNAIEVFAAKHNINSKCKYYIARREKEGSVVEDVTGNVETIYNQLAKPFQFLENERWTIDD